LVVCIGHHRRSAHRFTLYALHRRAVKHHAVRVELITCIA
jgi:hypothetical protein